MKIFTFGILLTLSTLFANAQNGLECLVVEKYYISDGNDTTVNSDGGVLPAGSVTYRIYADMLPGYKFQAGYGETNPPHDMRIETTTLFFNNEDRGDVTPGYTKLQASHNTVMLDSWLSVGAACTGNFGIMKANDDGVATVVNTDGVLQNNDSSAGIPLTVQDGFIAGTPEAVTLVGLTTEILVFNDQNDGTNGPLFFSNNGSWACLNGATGPDSIDNKVLIAQITTDGVLSFELNVQVGTPLGGVEKYVAANPSGNEIMLPCMMYNSLTALVEAAEMEDPSFMVYPNPAKGSFTMEISATRPATQNSYTIYDINGRVVMHRSLGRIDGVSSQTVDVSSLPGGQYFLELEMEGRLSVKKIVVY
jgi:hypothetical protein